MPFTLSHPAAILPLRRLTPRLLDFPALVIGSMTPDFGYYLPGFKPPLPTHSLSGSLLLCLPVGLLLLAVFHLLKRPLCFLLPQPHRAALTPLAVAVRRWKPGACLAATLSLLIGSWTHIAWDSFTHYDDWGVQHLALLRQTLWSVDHRPVAVCVVVQFLSGLAGGLVLLESYRRWLKRQAPVTAADAGGDGWRCLLLGALALASLAAAVPAALAIEPQKSPLALHEFLFTLWVRSALFGIILLIASGLLVAAWNPQAQRSRL